MATTKTGTKKGNSKGKTTTSGTSKTRPASKRNPKVKR